MTRICAYCEQEGKDGYMGEKAPLDDRSPTHGICAMHFAAQIEKLNQGQEKERLPRHT